MAVVTIIPRRHGNNNSPPLKGGEPYIKTVLATWQNCINATTMCYSVKGKMPMVKNDLASELLQITYTNYTPTHIHNHTYTYVRGN